MDEGVADHFRVSVLSWALREKYVKIRSVVKPKGLSELRALTLLGASPKW